MITMADALAQIEEVAGQAETELAGVKDANGLEQYRIKFLGSNGSVKNLARLISEAPKEQKRAVGQRMNEVKGRIEEAFAARKLSLSQDASSDRDYVDITEPGRRPQIGNRHILMKVVDELTELFGRMGFSIATGPEVEDEFHNFVALNIPESHPARDPLDNFYLQNSSQQGQLLLRTQTSTVQIRVMQTQKPPIRVVIPGRVYRPDTIDATHLPMFHQLEALVVDRDVTMVDLKSTIMQFAHAYFGQQTRVRFRPSFFPFTEPSAEVDVWFEDKQRWIELGGCGMVHPNVFKNCGIDPEEYSGWAFGLGIERIAMRKYGIQDIRSFVENDIRFLSQF
jgi:phenylalanyl-tRNA synthetase alpha chain